MNEKALDDAIGAIADKHGFSPDAVIAALTALQRTSGSAAQFSHPEFGGSVQWMHGGMIQIGDMFNASLRVRVGRLLTDMSGRLPEFDSADAPTSSSENVGANRGRFDSPASWGRPSSAGSQNGIGYAFFPTARRLVVETNGTKSVYDTENHRINGVSQQQGQDSSLAFSTADGTVDISRLTPVSDELS